MLLTRNHTVAGRLLAATLMIVAFGGELMAEEYVWARFYGSNQPSGYSTDGFGSYYVPKSLVTSKLQTDPIKKTADPKSAAKKITETKSDDPVVESQTPKPAPQRQKSFWKRLTFQK
jgi:hypothetical protein